MADEAVHAVRGSGKITYDTKVYVAFARELTEKCQELNTLGESICSSSSLHIH